MDAHKRTLHSVREARGWPLSRPFCGCPSSCRHQCRSWAGSLYYPSSYLFSCVRPLAPREPFSIMASGISGAADAPRAPRRYFILFALLQLCGDRLLLLGVLHFLLPKVHLSQSHMRSAKIRVAYNHSLEQCLGLCQLPLRLIAGGKEEFDILVIRA